MNGLGVWLAPDIDQVCDVVFSLNLQVLSLLFCLIRKENLWGKMHKSKLIPVQ